MSRRMTKELRTKILAAMRTARFGKAREELKAAEYELGEYLYEQMVPNADQAAMAALPDNYFCTNSEILVVAKRDGLIRLQLRSPRSMPAWLDHAWLREAVIGPERWRKVERYLTERRAFMQAVRNFDRTVECSLRQYTTVKQLLDACPDLEGLCPFLTREEPKLPVAHVDLSELVTMALAAKGGAR